MEKKHAIFCPENPCVCRDTEDPTKFKMKNTDIVLSFMAGLILVFMYLLSYTRKDKK